MFKEIRKELRNHAPFTIFGAITGIIVIIVFRKMPSGFCYSAFYILHPMHVVLSALVTASMYEIHKSMYLRRKRNLLILLIIGCIMGIRKKGVIVGA